MAERQEDRRRYIRVKDRVLLDVKPLPKEEVQSLIKGYESGEDVPWRDFSPSHMVKDITLPLSRIKERDEALATILEVIDAKLNYILKALAKENLDYPNKKVLVDLSAAGIAFNSDAPMEVGQHVQLDFGLLPENHFIRAFGKVVRCEMAGNGYDVGIEFVWMLEDDKDRLIEHVFQRQVQQLRMMRQRREQQE